MGPTVCDEDGPIPILNKSVKAKSVAEPAEEEGSPVEGETGSVRSCMKASPLAFAKLDRPICQLRLRTLFRRRARWRATFQRSRVAVLLPESFRGGCSFGASIC